MTDPQRAATRLADAQFGRILLQAFEDPARMPVHLLFNRWWPHAPSEVTAAYVEAFLADVVGSRRGAETGLAEPIDLDRAGRLPLGTLGRTYHDWIVDNDLQASIATDYRSLHQTLADAGMLDGMPEVMQSAVLRGFQVHDFQHVVTGYDPSGRGEIALQAFCLAQTTFPYFGMWMSVVTTRMTFVDPAAIGPMMDAIADGWQHGGTARTLAFEP
jgi:ubiquinone biosynthesis protein Coq4